MKITLYAIAKNEEKNVSKFVEISKKFDDVVVVDTGSTEIQFNYSEMLVLKSMSIHKLVKNLIFQSQEIKHCLM